MKIFYCDQFVLPLPEGHRFPMAKYARLRERVRDELVAASNGRLELRVPDAATDAQLEGAHDPEYVARVVRGGLSLAEVRRIGFPWSPELVERSRRSVGGTIGAARAALLDGFAGNLAGGTHHAFADRGEGFCVFNDVAVAARVLRRERGIGPVAVIDLDVHQGNGTAAIFSGDPDVFTLSIHGSNNFPFEKVAGDLDIALPDGTGDAHYLEAIRSGVERALAGRRKALAFYVAGADPFIGDRLGRLEVTREGLRERDRIVFDACAARGIPCAVVMAGGYAKDVEETVDIHFGTFEEAAARAG